MHRAPGLRSILDAYCVVGTNSQTTFPSFKGNATLYGMIQSNQLAPSQLGGSFGGVPGHPTSPPPRLPFFFLGIVMLI